MLEGGGSAIGLIKKKCIPLATTCGLYKDKLITDPSAEEERLMDTLLTIALDGSGRMIGEGSHSKAELQCTPSVDVRGTRALLHLLVSVW